ncbi:MAG: bifunctional 4-hydroxy-2-oxoglutarate aldolase/2-dehydro-3-deoxy-phosphogluconate aldolase [Puniceicoccaceae bacterium]
MKAFPEDLLQRLQQSRVVAGFSVDRAEDAVPVAEALLAGGIDAIELTLRTEAGIEAIRHVHENVPGMLAGVGTILRPDQAIAVKEAGADFGVSPGLNPRVIQAAQVAGLPFAPGIVTPTDLEAAIESGCRLVKFFPAESSGGLAYLKSMAAPYKHLGIRYFPLGGINAGNMMDYLNEDIIAAVGGSWIVKKELVDAGDWAGITARATEVRRILEHSTD